MINETIMNKIIGKMLLYYKNIRICLIINDKDSITLCRETKYHIRICYYDFDFTNLNIKSTLCFLRKNRKKYIYDFKIILKNN